MTGREKFRYLSAYLLGLAFCLVLTGAIPFVSLPSVGSAVWQMGFSESFAHGPLWTIYAHDIGYPWPAPIAFGLSAAWPASLFLRLGLNSADAYSLSFAIWFAVAYWGACRVGRYFGLNRISSVLGGLVWMSLPVIWNHNGFAALALGVALLPFYMWAVIDLLAAISDDDRRLRPAALLFIAACLIAAFMDGYTFMMFAAGAGLWAGWRFLFDADGRRSFVLVFVPVYLLGFGLAASLYIAYVGSVDFPQAPLDFFRSFGLDLSFLAIPTRGLHWFWDLVGFGVDRPDRQFFGDASIWSTTFSLPMILIGLLSWWRSRRSVSGATALLVIALFGLYLSLGPSLKIDSLRSETMGQSSAFMPADAAIAPSGTAWLWEHAPGFKKMRAVYRWVALGYFGFWALAILVMRRTGSKWGLSTGVILACGLVISNLPHVAGRLRAYELHRAMFLNMKHDLSSALGRYLSNGDRVAFLPYYDDFLVNQIAPTLHLRSYNIGGDKNVWMAAKHWPTAMRSLGVAAKPVDLFRGARSMFASNELDKAVVLFLDPVSGAQRWPAPLARKVSAEQVIALFAKDPFFEITRTEYGAVIALTPSMPASVVRKRLQEGSFDHVSYPIDLDRGAPDPMILGDGWYSMEPGHIWSTKRATLILPLPDDCGDRSCKAMVKFIVFGASNARPVDVTFTRGPEPDWAKKLTVTSQESNVVAIPFVPGQHFTTVVVDIPLATSPADLMGADDRRVLGIALQSISVTR